MLPLIRFQEMLLKCKEQMDEDLNELIGAAHIIGSRPNYLTVDEHGYYHVQASGKMDEVILALEKQVEKLQRIRQQKERN